MEHRHQLETDLGTVVLYVRDQRVVALGGQLTVNRIPYHLGGLLYLEDDEWLLSHPDVEGYSFALIRRDDMNRSGTKAAYEKVAAVLRPAVSAWYAERRSAWLDYAVAGLEAAVSKQRQHTEKLRQDHDYLRRHYEQVKGQEVHLEQLEERLAETRLLRSALKSIGPIAARRRPSALSA